MQGVVKVYDPKTGIGVIIREDTNEPVYLRPGSLDGSLFRMLRQGQRVVFDLTPGDESGGESDGESSGGRQFAHRLRFGSDGY